SATANIAVTAGIKFAKEIGAKLTGYYAIQPVESHIYGEGYLASRGVLKEFENRSREVGEKFLASMGAQANAAGLKFDSVCDVATTPYEGIIDAAHANKCDLIIIASHGRRGLEGL